MVVLDIGTVKLPPTGEEETVFMQLELPLKALPWVADRFTQYYSGARLGGAMLKWDEVIDGEHIYIIYSFGSTAPDKPGLTLANFSRESHLQLSTQSQELSMSDEMFLDEGMLKTWQELAERYNNGTL
ncbi:hypothetical protein [Alkalilimnicola ehrlichii]|uniref:Uncharacterized protein n=1 Tax=Alkalilimnicola ehrlichii TaxID=351052 RepID=A0A3E0WGT2_9GAMM|nr:hypothetical protein [Alkalilimnicola ehrlichii]RFA32172.1 hypothetical protein CAL65_20340 [Alkalilimnicola ehrlichii]